MHFGGSLLGLMNCEGNCSVLKQIRGLIPILVGRRFGEKSQALYYRIPVLIFNFL